MKSTLFFAYNTTYFLRQLSLNISGHSDFHDMLFWSLFGVIYCNVCNIYLFYVVSLVQAFVLTIINTDFCSSSLFPDLEKTGILGSWIPRNIYRLDHFGLNAFYHLYLEIVNKCTFLHLESTITHNFVLYTDLFFIF